MAAAMTGGTERGSFAAATAGATASVRVYQNAGGLSGDVASSANARASDGAPEGGHARRMDVKEAGRATILE